MFVDPFSLILQSMATPLDCDMEASPRWRIYGSWRVWKGGENASWSRDQLETRTVRNRFDSLREKEIREVG
jgi:hypothetical protein